MRNALAFRSGYRGEQRVTRPNPNLILYGVNRLGPKHIDKHLFNLRDSGFTTIVFGMFHIGNDVEKDKKDMKLGDIIYNGDEPLVVQEGKSFPPPYAEDSHWPGKIGLLKGNGSTITKIYASFGGDGQAVQDFKTIKTIYEKNGRSFSGTQLEKNLLAFRRIFPAVDGIDMDCEETYDLDSFVAFCKLLMTMGFEITFCPYLWDSRQFWIQALIELRKVDPQAVKWWNLQCYSGGIRNTPQVWAQAVAEATNQPIDIMAGDGVRYWGEQSKFDEKSGKWITVMDWGGNCPPAMTEKFSEFSKEPCLGGGFIWDLDLITKTQNDVHNPSYGIACPGNPSLDAIGYLNAMKKGLSL